MDMREKKIKSEAIYEGKVVKLYRDDVICPNGKVAKREVVRHNGGSAILCINNNKVLLIRQFRYAYDEVMYEIPAGKLELGEDPYSAALREFEEETGNKAEKLEYLGKIYPSCGYTDEIIYLYLAENYVETKTNFDEDEFIETVYLPIKEVKQMILDGIIKDSKTICAISYYLLKN